MKLLLARAVVFAALSVLMTVGTGYAADAPVAPSLGEGLFESRCARCHGPKGTGTDTGPPLVHRIYHPNHHSDYSFMRAISIGVRAHHWRFGDMEKVSELTEQEVGLIIKYIRSIQQDAGIF